MLEEKLTSLPIDLEADDDSIENDEDKDDSPGDDGRGVAIFYLLCHILRCKSRKGLKLVQPTLNHRGTVSQTPDDAML